MARSQAGVALTASEAAGLELAARRLAELATRATQCGVALTVDAEESWIQQVVDREVEAQMRLHNRGRAVVFTTVQLYLSSRLEYLRDLIEDARRNGYVLGVKLVRGAYMAAERARAQRLGYPSPVHATKAACDDHFDQAVALCLANLDHVEFICATHNVASIDALRRRMGELGIAPDDPRVVSAQLYGMFDCITYALAAASYRAAKYVPYGAVREVVPYLIRRAEENASVAAQSGGELARLRSELARRRQPAAALDNSARSSR
jgi:proline dehydrogenase